MEQPERPHTYYLRKASVNVKSEATTGKNVKPRISLEDNIVGIPVVTYNVLHKY